MEREVDAEECAFVVRVKDSPRSPISFHGPDNRNLLNLLQIGIQGNCGKEISLDPRAPTLL